jgi:acetate kinase
MSDDGVVLVVNSGSTSLKLSTVGTDGSAEPADSFSAVEGRIAAVAHRVVHGGLLYREPLVVDDGVERALGELAELAPLHNSRGVAQIREARRALPDVPHVAVFDTAFHATLPEIASVYAVPQRWRDEWDVRRFGFHGLSVQWAAERVAVPRLVVCHLGGGCSVTAVRDGRSVDTTMGFSPLEGVPMATRSGSLDAEIVLHLLRTAKLGLEEVEHALVHESGLLGLSGSSGRVDELERTGDPRAKLALELFAYRVAAAVAAMTVALDGLDALVFTAGVGEGSDRVREDVCARLRFLGVELDSEANAAARPDADIAALDSPVRVVVLRAREDFVAARAARALLGIPQAASVEPLLPSRGQE